ncbi:unnamed protein product [Bursaphelenchus okinawaensis]|uniref:CUE domain-containing protein n=1 Tax=Bursaphelenchus okinawaensis TaxID=465554 RepID=A0A811KZE3_9BILA|nr:unnamed protein product [Bursaphelenchus okinawaensis]CAG9114178.1 unnamed protein product [Bursaphelenchus okinawaensis]
MFNLAADVRIEEQFASTAPEILLPFVKPDGSNLNQWIARAEGLLKLLQAMVASTSNVFWSSICLRPNFMREIDSASVNFPFFEDLQDGNLLKRAGQSRLVVNLYQNLWILFIRICVSWESEGISEENFKKLLVEKHKIVTLERIRLACGLFSKNFYEVLKKIVIKLRKTVPALFNTVQKELDEAGNQLETLAIEIRSLHNELASKSTRNTKKVIEVLQVMHTARRRIFSWSEFLRILPEVRCSDDMANIIAETTQTVDDTLNHRVIMNLGAESVEISISLTRERAALLQALTHLFVRFFERSDESERIDLLFGLRDQTALMSRLEDRLKIKEKLPYLIEKTGMGDHGAIIKREIDKALEQKSKEIVVSLESEGLLAHLGEFSNPVVQENVLTLKDIVPYTTEFLHLVFRHFAYDMEKAIAALMEPDNSLPFNLRILMRDSSNLKAAKPSKRQQLLLKEVYEQDSEAESDHEDDADAASKAQNIDIVSLLTAPIASSSTSKAPILTEKEIKQQKMEEKLAKLMKKSGDLFNLRHLHGVVEKMQQIKMDQKSVVNVGGKKFAKFRKEQIDDELDEEDRNVIKQHANAYKYELSDEDDQDGRLDLDEKFRAEVGATGRFNRGQVVAISTKNYADEEDEYDDTYDDVNIAVDERSRIPEERHKATEMGYEGTAGSIPQGGYAAEHQRRADQSNKKIPDVPRRQPVTVEKAPKQNPMKIPRTDQQQQSKAGPQGNPQPKSQKQSALQPGTSGAQTKKDGYTGGKQRLNKERNKNKHKQRGADKKMARANPF